MYKMDGYCWGDRIKADRGIDKDGPSSAFLSDEECCFTYSRSSSGVAASSHKSARVFKFLSVHAQDIHSRARDLYRAQQ